MVKDIKYIIKRILISVGVILVLSFLRGNLLIGVNAQTYQGLHYYSNNDLIYNNNFPTTSSNIVNFDFDNNLNLPDNSNTTYLLNIPCSFSITYGSLQWYVGSDSSYATIKDISFQYFIVGNYSSLWIPGTFTNGMLQFYVPGGTQLHNLTIKFTTPNGINQTHNASYSISLNSGITYYKLGSNQDVINNNNQNTQDIINNQNDNSQQQIESQKVCENRTLTMNKILFDNSSSDTSGYLNSSGTILNNVNWKVTDYISLNSNQSYTLSGFVTWSTPYYCIYDENEQLESCAKYSTRDQSNFNTTLSFTTNKKVRFSYSQANAFNVTLSGRFCSNGNQAIVDSQKDLNNTLNNSSTDDPNSDINSMNSKTASNNSITQLLTLPITLFQNVLNNINGSCSSYNLGSLYGTSLSLPCINLELILGSTLWGVIDVLISGLFILSFRKKMVDIFNHMSSLNDRGNELE